jgi:hypothetical protein
VTITKQDVMAAFTCGDVIFDGEDIWISEPMAGHWLTEAEKAFLVSYLASKPLAVEATDPRPPKEENAKPKPRTYKERVRREALTDQQRHQASLIAFACIMAADIKEPGDALELGVNLIKLRDKCALHARRVALMTGDSTPGLVKRTNTLYAHIRGIISKVGELVGPELKAAVNDDGSFDLKYGRHTLHLG